MSLLVRAGSIVLVAAGVVATPAAPLAAQQPKSSAKGKPADVFGDTRVLQIHITMPAKEYEAMQPPAGGGFGIGFGPPPMNPPPKKDGQRDSDRSVFGTEFPIVRGAVAIDGASIDAVAFRYKGNSTFMATARGLKRSIKVDFDHYNEKQQFQGLKSLNLHCGVHDPSQIRETVCYAMFRLCGVPAPRTALAEVTLTVPGKYEKEYVGLYTATEQVSKAFLREHYKKDSGLLMKPERIRSLDFLGDDWERYKTTYQPKRDATPDEQKRVIEFTRLVNRGDDAQFSKEIASYLEIDAFLRFLAANALVSNLDSFFTNGHNYYLYLHPETKKFHFIPWDVDLAMGNFAFYGSAEQQMDLSLAKPYMQCRLADRLMGMKEINDRYQQIVKDLAATKFTRAALLKEIAAVESVAKPLIEKDAKALAARREGGGGPGFGGPGGGMFGRPPEMRTFAEKRLESIAAQVAGKSKGYLPQMAGFGGPPPGGFGPGNQIARPLLEALDANRDGTLSETELAAGMKKFFSEWDANKDGTLDQQEIANGLQKLMPAPKGPPFGGPKKG